jgi:predicted acetyltransferase
LAGFALVNRWSALDRPLDHAVGEFFELHKYRRPEWVGAPQDCCSEVGVAWYNLPALAFWRAVVRSAADGPVEEWPGDGTRWSGIVLSFAAGQ